MTKKEVSYSLELFEKALNRLEESIGDVSNDLSKDGVIQRFEFTFELMWKCVKIYCTYVGKSVKSPREALKEAFKQGIINNEKVFLEMLEDRNLSTHTYDENASREIYDRIEKKYIKAMTEVFSQVQAALLKV